MPVISFISSKGGCGKTTSALILACELAEVAAVTVIDCEPRKKPLVNWASLAPLPHAERFKVQHSRGERFIQDEIEAAAEQARFVIVDLEGAAARMASFVMGESDLVVIATMESPQDADEVVETIAELRRQSRALRREIPFAVLLTRTKAAVKSRTNRHVAAELRALPGARIFETEINERDAYQAVFSFGGGPRQLDPSQTNGLDRAVDNALRFAAETIEILKEKVDA